MTRKKKSFYFVAFFAIALGVLFDYLFYQKPIGVAFFVFNFVLIIFSLVLVKRFERKVGKMQIFILASILLFSTGILFRSSGFLTFFNYIGSIYLIFFFFSLFLNRGILSFSFLKYSTLPFLFPLRSFFSSAGFVRENRKTVSSDDKTDSKKIKSVIRGIMIAFPFLIILFWLLSSADLVFQSYATKYIHIDINFEVVLRFLKIAVISYFFIGIFSGIMKGKKAEGEEEKTIEERKIIGSIESSTVLVLVELLFLSFIVVQFFYLFGGKDYVWGIEGYITYAEYAKKGFHELIFASIISFVLVFGLDKFGVKETLKEKKIFKILGAVLVLEMLVIIFSAYTRFSVYIDGYGLTFSRFLVFIFLFWICFAFLNFLYKIFKEKDESFFLLAMFCFSILFWGAINIINPDAYIARKNIERLSQGKHLDSFYLYNLSKDAIPEMVKIFQLDVSEETKREAAMGLYWKYPTPPELLCRNLWGSECERVLFEEKIKYAEQNQKWQSFNFSRKRAIEAINENMKEIVKYQEKYFNEEKMNQERFERIYR